MSALISDDYAALNRKLHEERADYGTSGQKWAKQVEEIAALLNTTSILDYGSGKGTLAAALPDLPIREYDPAVPGKDADPAPADFVVCTDVLEHIEPERLKAVLGHIRRLAGKMVMLTIDTGAAGKTLPDGRNAHLIQKDARWWLQKINDRFRIVQMQMLGRTIFIVARTEGVKADGIQ